MRRLPAWIEFCKMKQKTKLNIYTKAMFAVPVIFCLCPLAELKAERRVRWLLWRITAITVIEAGKWFIFDVDIKVVFSSTFPHAMIYSPRTHYKKKNLCMKINGNLLENLILNLRERWIKEIFFFRVMEEDKGMRVTIRSTFLDALTLLSIYRVCLHEQWVFCLLWRLTSKNS